MLPALAGAVSAASLLALGICLDALLLHDVSWAILAVAYTGAAIGLAGLMRAGVRLSSALTVSRSLGRALDAAPGLPGRPEIALVDDARPRAWCVGLLAPRVAVTTGAVALLSAGSLDAVIAHERHHAHRRDGLRRAMADVVAAGLFLLPGAARASERYGAVLELDADRAAALTPSAERDLARAMLAIDAPGSGVEADRVDRLLGGRVRVELAPRTLVAAGSLLVALAATAVACTVATGCVDIFVLKEEDATASRLPLLPVLALTAAVLAAGGSDRLRPLPPPETA